MVGTDLIPALALLYQGVRESWKFSYVAPKLSKKVKGNSEWMELRFRHPSPGNVQSNGELTAREMQRHHYKTPYPHSRYYVRNYWRREFQGNEHVTYRYFPKLEDMTQEEEARILGYVPGEDALNQKKRQEYLQALETHAELNEQAQEVGNRFEEIEKNPGALLQGLKDRVEYMHSLNKWDDMGDFEGQSPYLIGPDTYLFDYGLHHVPSYEMQVYIELEKVLDDMRDELEEKGQPVRDGNANNQKVLDSMNRSDQQQEVINILKQRNVKKLQ
mmetsp:Transcript_8076/g.11915  ORF Transcript_8076/g.11915 Transcript_8076/m.11915 type:complete len:273 (-) Transcript_8076:658-1476(-)